MWKNHRRRSTAQRTAIFPVRTQPVAFAARVHASVDKHQSPGFTAQQTAIILSSNSNEVRGLAPSPALA
jgi:hypothetical protein